MADKIEGEEATKSPLVFQSDDIAMERITASFPSSEQDPIYMKAQKNISFQSFHSHSFPFPLLPGPIFQRAF